MLRLFSAKAGSRASAEADVQILFSKVHVKAMGSACPYVRLWTVCWTIDSWLLQSSRVQPDKASVKGLASCSVKGKLVIWKWIDRHRQRGFEFSA